MAVTDGQNYADVDDSALVELARKDRAAFGVLYERYIKEIYRYLYYRTQNQHEAEDLASRVFHRALNHIDNYVERGIPFKAWLYRIAHNLVANWHRDRTRHKTVPLEDYVTGLKGDAPETVTELQDEKERLLTAIKRLPEERQQLIILKFVEKLSNQEIGEIMEKSEGAIKSLYHRTLLSLRDELTTGEELPAQPTITMRQK